MNNKLALIMFLLIERIIATAFIANEWSSENARFTSAWVHGTMYEANDYGTLLEARIWRGKVVKTFTWYRFAM